ncbi:hypothetical protein EV702DRAFT_1179095 [Suillus placidus]|uniref:Uncharacterized protein n=1 Tax=Suillus placidus TaxID=48579 RepID=A0A9P7D4F5_9AGAM|nr:hypothetical protein EV702DRAFT_1179095 [Suillus placidus]
MSSPVTPPNRHLTLPSNPTSPSNASFFYRITVGSKVSDDTLNLCAELFSSNYGIWGDEASKVSHFTKAVGWVTQLVVDEAVHQCYVMTQLLQTLKVHAPFSCINIVGLVSSHPAACNALAKYAGADLKDVDLDFIRVHANWILQSSPISYLNDAQLRGTLFEDNCDHGSILSVFTKFYVNHAEPLRVLASYQNKGQWCLGELADGHEFLAIFPTVPVSPIEPIRFHKS